MSQRLDFLPPAELQRLQTWVDAQAATLGVQPKLLRMGSKTPGMVSARAVLVMLLGDEILLDRRQRTWREYAGLVPREFRLSTTEIGGLLSIDHSTVVLIRKRRREAERKENLCGTGTEGSGERGAGIGERSAKTNL